MKRIIAIVLLFTVLFLCFIATKVAMEDSKDYPIEVYNSDFDEIDFSLEISSLDLSASSATGLDTAVSAGLDKENTLVDASYDRLRGWGLKRNSNNLPPDVDPGAAELLKKYNAYYIGDASEKVVYLTFDEGYENGYTPSILDTLKKHNVKAAFFITGPYLKEHQDLVRRMVEEGHIVGNHTVNHPSLPQVANEKIEDEVVNLDRVFNEKFGKNMKFLRPPKGEYSERTLEITSKLGYANLFWSFAYDDWYRDKHRGAHYAYDKVVSNLHNGAVLLLHAVSKDNADALDSVITEIKDKGYRIASIEELLDQGN